MTATTSLSDYYSNFILICKKNIKIKTNVSNFVLVILMTIIWSKLCWCTQKKPLLLQMYFKGKLFLFYLVGLTLKRKKKSIYNFLAETIIWNLMILGILLWRFERHKALNLESIELKTVLHSNDYILPVQMILKRWKLDNIII